MSRILFLAPYPIADSEASLKDGFLQRIKAVDREFETEERTYLSVSRRANLWPGRKRLGPNLVVWKVNMFLHFWLIWFLLDKHTNVYIHSLFGFFLVDKIANLKGKTIVLDAHGTVPEEVAFCGDTQRSVALQKSEARLFDQLSTVITVSQQMADFYQEKYPSLFHKSVVVKPIFSGNAMRDVDDSEQEQCRVELGIDGRKTVLLYSGNLQKWQNFDLMIDTIAQGLRDNYFIIILTGQPNDALRIIGNKIPAHQLVVKSVLPEELPAYYAIAHYGFILRDEHILNKVAAPTKLVEYLYYGMVPVVKYAQIGDAALLGYDYLNVSDFGTHTLSATKSEKNRGIALEICQQNKKNSLSDLFGTR